MKNTKLRFDFCMTREVKLSGGGRIIRKESVYNDALEDSFILRIYFHYDRLKNPYQVKI